MKEINTIEDLEYFLNIMSKYDLLVDNITIKSSSLCNEIKSNLSNVYDVDMSKVELTSFSYRGVKIELQ